MNDIYCVYLSNIIWSYITKEQHQYETRKFIKNTFDQYLQKNNVRNSENQNEQKELLPEFMDFWSQCLFGIYIDSESWKLSITIHLSNIDNVYHMITNILLWYLFNFGIFQILFDLQLDVYYIGTILNREIYGMLLSIFVIWGSIAVLFCVGIIIQLFDFYNIFQQYIQ